MDLRFPPRTPLLQAFALAGLALVVGTLSNVVASGQRRLGWLDSPQAPSVAAHSAPTVTPPEALLPAPVRPAPAATPPLPRPTPKPPPAFPPDPTNPVREITTAQAWQAFQAKALFLDARRSADFADGHVAGAWCAPVWEADVDTQITIFEATTKPATQDPLVLYCSGGDCEDSHMLAGKLLKLGYRNLLIYRGGFPDWVEQGRPVQRGARP